MSSPFPAKEIANYFLGIADNNGKPISPMKLLKLVYYAHGWHLALSGNPLIKENVEAWRFGPVVRCLYDEFKIWGNGPIRKRATSVDNMGNVHESQLPEDDTA